MRFNQDKHFDSIERSNLQNNKANNSVNIRILPNKIAKIGGSQKTIPANGPESK